MFRKKMTLHISLLHLAGVVFVILVIGLSIFILIKESRVAAAAVSATEMKGIVELARTQQETLIGQTQLTLSLISKFPADQKQGVECDQALSEFLAKQKHFLNFAVVNPEGNVLCAALPHAAKDTVSDRLYFKRAMESGKFSAGEYQIGRATHKPSINFAYPFKNEYGVIESIGIAALSLSWLSEFARATDLPPGATLTITDDRGTVLAQYGDETIGAPATELGYKFDYVVQAERELAIVKMRDQSDATWYVAVAPVGTSEQEGLMHIFLSVPEQNVSPNQLGSVINAL
jgi:hypothetical protein